MADRALGRSRCARTGGNPFWAVGPFGHQGGRGRGGQGQTQGHAHHWHALRPRPWLARSLEHIPAITQQHYDYLLHDALIKPMPQGEFTYSLAEHAEMTAGFTKAAFRLRAGLKFHDGHPL